MEIVKTRNGDVLEVALSGRLDTITSEDLSQSLEQETGFTSIVFDFAALDYLSSSGLRLLFAYRKKLGGKENVIVKNVNPLIMEIFRVTGFGNQITLQ